VNVQVQPHIRAMKSLGVWSVVVRVHAYMNIHVCVCMHVCRYMCVCVHVCMYACMYLYKYVSIHTYK